MLWMFRSVTSFDRAAIKAKLYTPTLLGQGFGLRRQWTITRVVDDGNVWTIDGNPMPLHKELTVTGKDVAIRCPQLLITYRTEWRGWLKETVENFAEIVSAAYCYLKPDGQVTESMPLTSDNEYDTAEIPVLVLAD